MANKKSAIKRIRQTERKNAVNSRVRSVCRTAQKKVRNEASVGNKDGATVALKVAEKEFAKAATKGVYHKKTAARAVSRMAKLVNNLG